MRLLMLFFSIFLFLQSAWGMQTLYYRCKFAEAVEDHIFIQLTIDNLMGHRASAAYLAAGDQEDGLGEWWLKSLSFQVSSNLQNWQFVMEEGVHLSFQQFSKMGDAKYTDLDNNLREIGPFTCNDARYDEIPDPIYKLLGVKKPRKGPIHITRDNISGSNSPIFTLEQAIQLINSYEVQISPEGLLTAGAVTGGVLWLVSAGMKRIPLLAIFAGTQVAAGDLCSRFDTAKGMNEFLRMDLDWQFRFANSCDNLSSQIFHISSKLNPE